MGAALFENHQTNRVHHLLNASRHPTRPRTLAPIDRPCDNGHRGDHMTHQNKDQTEALRAAAVRRFGLKEALSQVEAAAASPSAEEGWRTRLLKELEELRAALLDHIEEVEADDGLLKEMLALAPRLANQIGIVRDEHPDLCRQVDEIILDVRGTEDVIDLRSGVLDALTAVARHRQRGSDLVYDGYNVDIGGS